MCGFVGIWNKSGQPVSRDLEAMTGTFCHRGPDDADVAEIGHVALGFRRLKIIDLSPRGRQPMFNEDATLAMVFNGEIYNYKPLRQELIEKGHDFRSDADSEVVLHLYEEEGMDCVKKLRGMFAFCIYDKKKDLFFGARDRFGIKPLFYTETDSTFALASESKAFLNLPDFTARVNEAALPHYLTFQYVPEPETMFAGVYKIPPAHTFIWQNGKLSLFRYWQPTFNPQEDVPFEEFLEGTREIMRESVKLHTQADVPLGAFLSGGIDSTVIVGLLRELGPVSTFSVGYEDEDYSELNEARESATYLETDHHEYRIPPGEFWNYLPQLVWHFDDPVADPAAISLFFVAKMASKNITVTLSGEGADEVFGGYGIYRESQALRPLSGLPRPLLKAAHSLMPGFLPGKNYVRRASTPIEERYFGNAYIFNEVEKAQLLKQKNFPPATVITAPFYKEAADYDDVQKMQYIDIHTWMTGDILVKADKMTMANSLELRVPYLDHHVFEFASTIPTKYKIKDQMTKITLRQAFADLVPPSAVNRPKRGFPVPTRAWLRGPLAKDVASLLSDPALGQYFNLDYIKKLLEDHKAGRADNSRKLWTLVIFALWRLKFLD
ncbi:asparagine synthase (glutamine-hydrolyzing) [Dethiobacter alkaliphilus]|uniref:asparagine synthase (glutamine-hydrolyzing) n=1 Tax=Dethiobacter alkaliphilus TaxID=427926 RepID=UPI002227816D|nr:asparagine synthase (glutamine-hydrolyzing) [Dethiobacter alkaliphilus]MCW3491128.1 asparagine synthase (glutamine-hydrolyzing) [Dethiobacter alkaliphilus]